MSDVINVMDILYHFPAASVPTNLMAIQKGLTSIRVSWSSPIPLGDTTGYRISYGDNNDSVDISDGYIDNYLLTGLMMGATYTISIVATSKHIYSQSVDTMITLCKQIFQ